MGMSFYSSTSDRICSTESITRKFETSGSNFSYETAKLSASVLILLYKNINFHTIYFLIKRDKTTLAMTITVTIIPNTIPQPCASPVKGTVIFIPKNPVTIFGIVNKIEIIVNNFIVSFKLLFNTLLYVPDNCCKI